ncbi:MAG: hypothetical protein ACUVV3_09065 [Dehalococcoidia bacterium]
MRHVTKAWALLVMVGLLAALAAACGNGGEGKDKGSPTASPTAEGSATASPTAAAGALASCQALDGLKAYRYTMNLKVASSEPTESPTAPQPTPATPITRELTGTMVFEYKVDASYVAPDRYEASISGPGSPFTMILIGEQAWIQSNGEWRKNPFPQSMSYAPADLCRAILADLDLLQAEPEEEKVNDVKALHYSFPQMSSEQAMAGMFGAQSDMAKLLKKADVELWLAEKDEWPVRIDVHSSGFYSDGRDLIVDLVLDIKDANKGDIRVEPPQ